MTKFCAPQSFKKTGQKRQLQAFFGNCWLKNSVLSERAPSSNFLSINDFRKLAKNEYLEKSTQRDPFGSAGGQIPEDRHVRALIWQLLVEIIAN